MASCCLCFVRHVSSLTGRLVPCVIVPVSSYRNGRCCCCCHLAEPQTLIEAPTTTTMSSNINFLFWYKRTDGPQLFFRSISLKGPIPTVCALQQPSFFFTTAATSDSRRVYKKKIYVRPSVCRLFFFRKGPRVFIGENGTARALLTFPFFLYSWKKKKGVGNRQTDHTGLITMRDLLRVAGGWNNSKIYETHVRRL